MKVNRHSGKRKTIITNGRARAMQVLECGCSTDGCMVGGGGGDGT